MKEFADNNFKFDGKGRKLSKQVENTVGKGEIARFEQFLLFPWCFQKACFPWGVKRYHCVGVGYELPANNHDNRETVITCHSACSQGCKM